MVLVVGFESFNRGLYQEAAKSLQEEINLMVFSDSEIRTPPFPPPSPPSSSLSPEDRNDSEIGLSATPIGSGTTIINPTFSKAVEESNVFIGFVIFD